ncbi:MAG: thioredoxin domain-containing protein [bacterium]|nr:thioredoxin domain-containing protein [bacterium]
MATETIKRPWWKHWWGVLIIVFLSILGLLVIYFFQQFFKYYGLVRRGEISNAEIVFADRFTVSGQLKTSIAQAAAASTDTLATDDDPQIGHPLASMVIVEFADFGCPFSREASSVVRELAAKYSDRVRYIYRDLPLDDVHPDARRAAEAGECAQDQGNFWALHDKMYQNQDRLSQDDLIRYAQETGLDVAEFTACLESGKYQQEVQEDFEAGVAAGVRGTPTFFFNGVRVEGSIPKELFEKILLDIPEPSSTTP